MKLRAALERDPDYVTVFRELGKRLSLSNASDGTVQSAVQPEPGQTAPISERYISYYVEDARALGEGEPESETAAEEELPPAVAAFLESQAAFAQYALPENVDYDYAPLPFEYSSPVAGYQSSGFGYRLHPILHIVRFHFGTDVAANTGETVTAFAGGTVTFAGYDDSFGWHLKIDHGGGWISHYCHCSSLLVKNGDRVAKGDAVARVGATGLATGPHLHFELSRDGVFVNPEYYINV